MLIRNYFHKRPGETQNLPPDSAINEMLINSVTRKAESLVGVKSIEGRKMGTGGEIVRAELMVIPPAQAVQLYRMLLDIEEDCSGYMQQSADKARAAIKLLVSENMPTPEEMKLDRYGFPANGYGYERRAFHGLDFNADFPE